MFLRLSRIVSAIDGNILLIYGEYNEYLEWNC